MNAPSKTLVLVAVAGLFAASASAQSATRAAAAPVRSAASRTVPPPARTPAVTAVPVRPMPVPRLERDPNHAQERIEAARIKAARIKAAREDAAANGGDGRDRRSLLKRLFNR